MSILLHGDVPDIYKLRDAMRQLVDAHYFSESLHFQFIEENITKTTALDVVDAVRQREGLGLRPRGPLCQIFM